MEVSFVSRARIAINSAAAKAEKVLTEIKKSNSDSRQDTYSDKQSPCATTPDSFKDANESKVLHGSRHEEVSSRRGKKKKGWREKLSNIRVGKRGVEDYVKPGNSTMAYAIFDENLYIGALKEFSPSKDSARVSTEGSVATNADIIPSSAILKQLAVAVEAASNYNSMKDLHQSSMGSSPIRERASASLSAMKSLVLREKEDKLAIEFGSDERVVSVINVLKNAEGHHIKWRSVSGVEAQINSVSFLKDIHGAPVESFVVKLAEAFGCLKTLPKMASFWFRVVSDLRRLWYDGQYIQGIPADAIPDLNSCLLHQQLQVINCCISRKRRHAEAVEALESVTANASSNAEGDEPFPFLYARTKSGRLELRLGIDKECNLAMLETGELIYAPVMQEPPILTEDLLKETEEFVLRTGSVGAGCSQLLADMQAFKAANPGSILEDFVRWHSPPDWVETDIGSEVGNTSDCTKGQLSARMQKEGNLWREFWETSKPVPAVRQSPLYDEDLAVEGILDSMQGISPSELFKQLFMAILGSGIVIADAALSSNSKFSNLFKDCKKYIITTCQSNNWVEKLDDICQVYETVETMVLNPEASINEVEESTDSGESRNGGLISDGENKSSSKKPPKPTAAAATLPSEPSDSVETDSTVV